MHARSFRSPCGTTAVCKLSLLAISVVGRGDAAARQQANRITHTHTKWRWIP